MKRIMLSITLLFVAFSSAQNESSGNIATTITNPSPLTGETFRFGPGIVTQLDTGTSFDFSSSRWFSFGSLNTASQNVFGLRFQLPNRAITMGYQDINDVNPRIQWIGDGSFAGTGLEFRAANSFISTTSTLAATMTNDGKTFFGNKFTPVDETLVGVDYSSISPLNKTGITLQNVNGASGTVVGIKSMNNAPSFEKRGIVITTGIGAFSDIGVDIELNSGINSIGVNAAVNSNGGDTFGVRGTITSIVPTSTFGAGIYGSAPSTQPNWYAGYFDGDIVANALLMSSDKKLKEKINEEKNTLQKIMELNAVSYKFKQNIPLQLPEALQHGFIAQNIEKVFPELVTTIQKPVFDAKNNTTGEYEYKAVNYIGLISVLTASIQELNEKVQALTRERNQRKTPVDEIQENQEEVFSIAQNIPNPFSNVARIRYTVPNNTKATLAIFDMTGKYIKEYDLSMTKGEIVVNANDIGKGMFLYSLISGGDVIMTKKMLIR
ncbi:MAG: tail fiber domain-containing protein [Bacteroidota bacterium]